MTPPSSALGRGIACTRDRQSGRLSRFDCNTGSSVFLDSLFEPAIAVTALEKWAKCLFRYFLSEVLGVNVPDDDDQPGLSALERGLLVHRVLERFVSESPERQRIDQGWSLDERVLLH